MPTSRLITFLGKSDYKTTRYILDDQCHETCYVAQALGKFLRPKEIVVFATPEAWNKHGAPLTRELLSVGLLSPRHIEVGSGETPDDMWQEFDQLLAALNGNGSVAFDITHGFRTQPFFASAVIQFFQSIQQECSTLNVYYGAFEARNPATDQTPIWDLTAFVELLRWSRALLLFLRSGLVDDIAHPTEQLGKALRKQWALSGKHGTPPSLEQLGKAIQEFGNDFVTVRVGALIADPQSSSKRLLEALQRATSEVTTYLRPLAPVLQQVIALVKPLADSPRLSASDGQRALQSLAKTYLSMNRYAETAAILREGWITRYACSQADKPGDNDYSDAHREAAEKTWRDHDENLARKLADLRNDIGHAGFRRHPKPSRTIKQELQKLIEQWCSLDVVPSSVSSRAPTVVHGRAQNVAMYHIGVDRPITPQEPLPPLPDIPRGALVVIEGRAPIWRYGMALHLLHGSPAGAIAIYDPRLGAVVVVSHHPDWIEGDVIDVTILGETGKDA